MYLEVSLADGWVIARMCVHHYTARENKRNVYRRARAM